MAPLAWHLVFLRNLLIHKALVVQEGRALGLPYSQLLAHDLSKLSPGEYLAYVRAGRKGGALSPAERLASARALHLHRMRNPHHPEYWIRHDAAGRPRALPMPDRYRREMLADWRAVGRVLGTATEAWYLERFDTGLLHPETRAWLEEQLGV